MKISDGLIIIMGFLLAIVGTVFFTMGFHNIDLSRNMLWLSYTEHFDYYNYVDGTLGGVNVDYDNVYLNGMRMIHIGFVLSMVGGCLFGFGVRKR